MVVGRRRHWIADAEQKELSRGAGFGPGIQVEAKASAEVELGLAG